MSISARRLSPFIVALGLALMSAGAPLKLAAQNNSIQVVFSGTGLAHYDTFTNAPFGFWVWCLANAPASSKGVYHDCAGSMYFYEAQITKGVTGDISGSGSTWTMTNISSVDHKIDNCTLQNSPPIKSGPANTVMLLSCTAPSNASGTVTTAVVKVTGP